jgi:hypothetical protein
MIFAKPDARRGASAKVCLCLEPVMVLARPGTWARHHFPGNQFPYLYGGDVGLGFCSVRTANAAATTSVFAHGLNFFEKTPSFTLIFSAAPWSNHKRVGEASKNTEKSQVFSGPQGDFFQGVFAGSRFVILK